VRTLKKKSKQKKSIKDQKIKIKNTQEDKALRFFSTIIHLSMLSKMKIILTKKNSQKKGLEKGLE
jgi:hypothetical protein